MRPKRARAGPPRETKHCAVALAAAFACVLLIAVQARAQSQDEGDEEESPVDTLIVTATRSSSLVRDQPVRVEVVPQEEIEESLSVAPGNLTNLLNELAGIRMQVSAPGLGGTALQMRGLPGRHAQILADGLPLAGGQTDSFSLLQSPPLDLARVEVIKGVASALYGGSALSGVMNLVSRSPQKGLDVLLNQTSLGGTDGAVFASDKLSDSLGYSFTGSADFQSREDPDHDGWSEVAGYKRLSGRPRVFWQNGASSLYATFGAMHEDRRSGTLAGRTLSDGRTFAEALHTTRFDAGLVLHSSLAGERSFNTRWSASTADHDRVYGSLRVQDSISTVFGEATLQDKLGLHQWVLGGALQYDRLHTKDVAGVGYGYFVPSLFAQDEFSPAHWFSLSASARLDRHSDYGTFFSPRLSALVRSARQWSLRASAGTGFAAPTPLIEEVEARSLGLVNPLRGLAAERASSASLDGRWAQAPWDINLSVFSSEIRHPLEVEAAIEPERLNVVNGSAPLRSRGAELLIGFGEGPVHILANSTYLEVTQPDPDLGNLRRTAQLVPRFSAEIATIVEDEDRGRIGAEISYTGRQELWDDPFRTRSRGYFEINALAEIRLGTVSVFGNVLNITDKRQSASDPLLRPTPGLGGTPITDAWAPLTGRTYNIGLRLRR